MIKLALTVNAWLDEELMFAQQLGADQVIAQVVSMEPGRSEHGKARLAALRNRVEKAGLELLGLDCSQVPLSTAIQGEVELQQVIHFFRELITNAGEAGIGLIAYRWDDPIQHLNQLAIFLESVIPAAEANELRLAGSFHPHPTLGEWNPQTYERLLKILSSPQHGLDLDPYLLDWQNGTTPIQALLPPGLRERVFLITLERNLTELPLDEPTGEDPNERVDLFSIMETFHNAGSPASVRPSGQPGIPESRDIEYQEQAYISGYLRAILQTLKQNR